MKTEPGTHASNVADLLSLPPDHLRVRQAKTEHLLITQAHPSKKAPSPKQCSHLTPPSTIITSHTSSAASPPTLLDNLNAFNELLNKYGPVLGEISLKVMMGTLIGVLVLLVVGCVVGLPLLILWRAWKGC